MYGNVWNKKEYVRMCCAYRQTDMSRACIYCIICGYRGMNACVDSKRRRERDRVCLCVCVMRMNQSFNGNTKHQQLLLLLLLQHQLLTMDDIVFSNNAEKFCNSPRKQTFAVCSFAGCFLFSWIRVHFVTFRFASFGFPSLRVCVCIF